MFLFDNNKIYIHIPKIIIFYYYNSQFFLGNYRENNYRDTITYYILFCKSNILYW